MIIKYIKQKLISSFSIVKQLINKFRITIIQIFNYGFSFYSFISITNRILIAISLTLMSFIFFFKLQFNVYLLVIFIQLFNILIFQHLITNINFNLFNFSWFLIILSIIMQSILPLLIFYFLSKFLIIYKFNKI